MFVLLISFDQSCCVGIIRPCGAKDWEPPCRGPPGSGALSHLSPLALARHTTHAATALSSGGGGRYESREAGGWLGWGFLTQPRTTTQHPQCHKQSLPLSFSRPALCVGVHGKSWRLLCGRTVGLVLFSQLQSLPQSTFFIYIHASHSPCPIAFIHPPHPTLNLYLSLPPVTSPSSYPY